MLKATLFSAILPAAILAATHDVDVGKSGLNFSPDSITAAAGDTINFHFYAGDHGVASSSFSAPCKPAGGVWSGFIQPSGSADEASKMFTYMVTDTNPSFMYCPQSGHCQAGMAFAINPSSSQSIAAYQKAAANADQVAPPSAVGGGSVVPNVEGGGESSSAAPAMSSKMPASMMPEMSTAMAMTSAVAMSSMTPAMSTPAPPPASSPAATPAPPASMPAPVSQITDGQPQATSPGSPSYTGAANSNNLNNAAAAVVAAAGIWGWALL